MDPINTFQKQFKRYHITFPRPYKRNTINTPPQLPPLLRKVFSPGRLRRPPKILCAFRQTCFFSAAAKASTSRYENGHKTQFENPITDFVLCSQCVPLAAPLKRTNSNELRTFDAGGGFQVKGGNCCAKKSLIYNLFVNVPRFVFCVYV